MLSLTELEEIIGDQSSCLAVFEHEGDITGVILGTYHTTKPKRWSPERRFAYLEELVVTESMRGKGVAFALVTVFREWAENQGANCIDLNVWQNNDVAIAFYRRMGFEGKQSLMSLQIHG